MTTVIRAENLGKQFVINHEQQGQRFRYTTLGETLANTGKILRHRLRHPFTASPASTTQEDFWALKDINFEIQQGERVGIIGRNGAGKSTLLKILSRISPPTTGKVTIKGRVASLLEVGTGFHPELTGRENIFLNGAILGMRRHEIARKFDEIVAFAEVERFLDTPVKHYSSGMYVRLAFAVAAHLEPEILVVDEVLAVGDSDFQKKCLGKMENVAQQGRTVLFVSHNMGMITSLCQRAILLEAGREKVEGAVADVISHYYNAGEGSPYKVNYAMQKRKAGDQFATLVEAHIEEAHGRTVGNVDIRSPFQIKMIYDLHQTILQVPFPNFHFYNSQGQCVFVTSGGDKGGAEVGRYEATCNVPGNLLNNDTYFITLALTFTHSGIHVSFNEIAALAVTVSDPIEETLETMRQGYSGPIPGAVRPQLNWEFRRLS